MPAVQRDTLDSHTRVRISHFTCFTSAKVLALIVQKYLIAAGSAEGELAFLSLLALLVQKYNSVQTKYKYRRSTASQLAHAAAAAAAALCTFALVKLAN
jgi:hypothetical protein